MGGIARRSFQRDKMSVWNLSGLRDIFQVLDQLLIPSGSAEREEAVACLFESWEMIQQIISKEIDSIFQRIRTIIDEDEEKTGLKTFPEDTPALTGGGG